MKAKNGSPTFVKLGARGIQLFANPLRTSDKMLRVRRCLVPALVCYNSAGWHVRLMPRSALRVLLCSSRQAPLQERIVHTGIIGNGRCGSIGPIGSYMHVHVLYMYISTRTQCMYKHSYGAPIPTVGSAACLFTFVSMANGSTPGTKHGAAGPCRWCGQWLMYAYDIPQFRCCSGSKRFALLC